MTLDTQLLDILVCPSCNESLTLCPDQDGLLCEKCQVVYPVKEDIPVMLTDEAVPVGQWQGSK
ncbi:MAG: Trm112 family protein [Proteobacteria bacterium]|nr:Trm112 family protein [Pseudomonadota bacterium]